MTVELLAERLLNMGRHGALPKEYPPEIAVLRAGISHGSPKAAGRRIKVANPTMPKWLTPYGKATWRRVVKELGPLGLLNPVDLDTLAGYCDAVSFARDARDLIRADGLVIEGTHNSEKVRHPAYMIWQQSIAKVESLGKLLALNPSARLRLLAELEEPDNDDDLD
jgi:P27 family predicted phage terminase small subunit